MTLTKRKPTRPTKADQKRSGQHHHVGHHYLKAYWPYLPILATFLLGFTANSWISGQYRSVLGYATDLSVSSLLTDTNAARAAYNQTPLALNDRLDNAAQAKADDMAARNYWSHDTPDGRTPGSFITAEGYTYQAIGENLAYGFTTAQSIMSGWMNSPEHRANILNTSYRDIGFGIVNTPNYQGRGPETLVVALYALPAQPAVVTASATIPPTTTNEPSADQVSRIQLIAGSAGTTWALIILIGCGGLGVILLTLRQGLAWRKVIVKGERFILAHPTLDVIAVFVVTVSVVLARTAGFIH